jgi:hypothetical protein
VCVLEPGFSLSSSPLTHVKVAMDIYEQCIVGLLLPNAAVVLVTHQLQFAMRAPEILVLDRNGTARGLGPHAALDEAGLWPTQNELDVGNHDDEAGPASKATPDSSNRRVTSGDLKNETRVEGQVCACLYVP